MCGEPTLDRRRKICIRCDLKVLNENIDKIVAINGKSRQRVINELVKVENEVV